MKMKKILLALSLAATTVSGSAMAWEANGPGGNVDLGGTLTPKKDTPWEVKVGDAVSGLNAQIKKDQQVVDIELKEHIPVLGIRTKSNKAFQGRVGIAPNIDFKGAINVGQFDGAMVPLTLDVKDTNGAKIGTLTTMMAASSKVSVKEASGRSYYSHVYASTAGQGFFGGLADNKEATPNADHGGVTFPDAVINFDLQGGEPKAVMASSDFADTNSSYSAYYASGINFRKGIKITLDTPATGDVEIPWTATLPVEVSYL